MPPHRHAKAFWKGLIMDFEQNSSFSGPMQQGPSGPLPATEQGGPGAGPPSKGTGWKIFFGIVLVLSVMANVVLVLMLIGIVAVFAAGQRALLAEEIIRKGPARNKIAVISLQGVIYGEQAKEVYGQIKAARRDKHVKGLILHVNSPGGTISGSDQIHKEILKFREEHDKPVVAFMQGVAASGGYYVSVACDKIIAEPTTITGSIGVISWYLVVQELLEDKLGVLPVVIKSGLKKDWPSSFRKPQEQETQYLREKVLTPAYERFIEVVTEGRKASLTEDQIRQLADGGIFSAEEALKEKLIDQIGYLDEAIELVKSLAGIEEAQVVQYRRPFSLSDFLSYRKANFPKIDKSTLYELGTPQVLYLWTVY
jgi:protease-4